MIYGCECCGAKWEQEIKVIDGKRAKPSICPNPRCKAPHLWLRTEDSFKPEFRKNLWWYEEI